MSTALAKRRDAVLRRWLGMEVERSSVGQLAERPLSERLRELEELFDAAVHELSGGTAAERDEGFELRDALDNAIQRHRTMGMPFTLALLAAPSDNRAAWTEALSRATEEDTVVVDGGGGIIAAILPGVRPREADVAVDRLRAHAWSAAGCQGRLPAAGRASCPVDGELADQLLSVANERLYRMSEATLDRSRFERQGRPAAVTPLYPELG
ncbi:MAG TPA: RsbRD N-terminal domain-containing protein [Thermoleophilaceae bacterium]